MRVGIDIGGSKIEAITMDAGGAVRQSIRIDTPRDYAELLEALERIVDEFRNSAAAVKAVGVGTPGALDPETGRMNNAHNTPLQGQAFGEDLVARLGLGVRVANDANCFALSEATDGAAAGARSVFGVILGTGVGGGVVVEGRVLVGANAIAGEWGHNPLPHMDKTELPGPLCTCGRQGCIEAFLSGPAMARDHAARTGETTSAKDIGQRAREGDRNCIETLELYAERLARALASVINVLDPEVIVLGGGVSRIDAIHALVRNTWCSHVFSERVRTRLVANRFGDSSGVRGAAWLWSTDELAQD